MFSFRSLVPIIVGAALVLPVLGPAGSTSASAAADKTYRIDVDGDGRKDKVGLYFEDSTILVKVITAKHKSSSLRTLPGEFNQHLYKAAKLDGVKGRELIFITDEEYITSYDVFTWRKGKLVRAKVPPLRNRNDSLAGWTPGDGEVSGFRFFSSKGKRYVDATYLWFNEEAAMEGEPGWEGATYRSVWASGKWHLKKTIQRRQLTQARAEAYSGFHGI